MKKTLAVLTLLLLAAAAPASAQGNSPTLSATVIFATAYLRETPSASGAVVAQAAQGDRLTLAGRTADGDWYLAVLDTGEGVWLANYLVTLDGDPAILPVITPPSPQVIVPPGCEYFNIGPFYGQAGQSVVLVQGWEAASRQLVEDYRDQVLQIVSFDGRLISTYAAYASEVAFNEARGTWQIFWRFDMGPVAVGEHRLEWTQMFNNRVITDGLDNNGDGQPDTYGPDPVTYGCTLIIQP